MLKKKYIPEYNLTFGKQLNNNEKFFLLISILFTVINLSYSLHRKKKPVDSNNEMRVKSEGFITGEIIFIILAFVILGFNFKRLQELNKHKDIINIFFFILIGLYLLTHLGLSISNNKEFILINRNDKSGSIAIFSLYLILFFFILFCLIKAFGEKATYGIHVHDHLRGNLFIFSLVAIIIIFITILFLYLNQFMSENIEGNYQLSELLNLSLVKEQQLKKNQDKSFSVFFGIFFTTIVFLFYLSIYSRYPLINFLPQGGKMQKYQDASVKGGKKGIEYFKEFFKFIFTSIWKYLFRGIYIFIKYLFKRIYIFIKYLFRPILILFRWIKNFF